MTTQADVALLRIAAQHLAGPGLPTATNVVRWMTDMQGQDLPGALASVALRTGGPAAEDGIVAALNAGAVVRSWPMRGTLHLVPAEDLGWMLALTSERILAGAARRRAELGVDEALVEQATQLATDALAGDRSLSRTELLELWAAGGLLGTKQRGYHLIVHLAQRGILCLGPMTGREQQFVLLDEWVPRPRGLEPEEALGEWALRYFRSHGPATRNDFVWWTKLTAAKVDAGLAVARPRLESVQVDGVEHLMDPGTPERLAGHRRDAGRVRLLPGFDELILGYQDRSASLPGQFADRIVPGKNGVFRPTVVARGRVVGTWKRVGSGARRRVEAQPFTTFTQPVERAISRAGADFPEPAAG